MTVFEEVPPKFKVGDQVINVKIKKVESVLDWLEDNKFDDHPKIFEEVDGLVESVFQVYMVNSVILNMPLGFRDRIKDIKPEHISYRYNAFSLQSEYYKDVIFDEDQIAKEGISSIRNAIANVDIAMEKRHEVKRLMGMMVSFLNKGERS